VTATEARTEEERRDNQDERALERRHLRVPDGLWSALAVPASLVFLAPLLAIAGEDISGGYDVLFSASFSSTADLGFLLLSSTPLLLVGLGVAIPLRAGLFNLGGEGQLIAGALAAVFLATQLPEPGGVPFAAIVPLAAALVAGGLVGALAGVIRAWRGASEIVVTLMLSFIFILLAQYLVSGPMLAEGAVYATTDIVPLDFRLAGLGPDNLVPVGFIIAVLAAVVTWIFTEFSRTGWRQRMIGLNARVAERQGYDIGREGIVALTLGGALAGAGGAAELLGNQLRVGVAFSPGWGFDAIVIALLARANALAVIPFALYFGFLRNGALSLQQNLEVPPDLVLVMGGAPVILLAAILGYRAYIRFTGNPEPD
jgi:ABC-type uncharacterized transport system permease subunit